MNVNDLQTPALTCDLRVLDRNIATMTAAKPGAALRPHLKALKCSELTRHIAASGHHAFCGATAKELVGVAGLDAVDDLLLANELLDGERLTLLAAASRQVRMIVAVDSEATIDAAVRSGLSECLIDVSVGLPRGGCVPAEASRLAMFARRRGMNVAGVMGYEGHLMTEPAATKPGAVAAAMTILEEAHSVVGGDIISGGGTGTYAVNETVTECQAGSFALMDTDYATQGLPFREALRVVSTVLTVHPEGWVVLDAGLKAMTVEHGNPTVDGGDVWYCSDEHLVFAPTDDRTRMLRPGDRVMVRPSHVDPTLALHETLHVVEDDVVVGFWPIDLRGW